MFDAPLLTWVPRLRRYAHALVGNREDADDLVQDTLERAWSRSSLWRGVVDMRAWLFGIMHNLHVDRLRRTRLATVPIDEHTPEGMVPRTRTSASPCATSRPPSTACPPSSARCCCSWRSRT